MTATVGQQLLDLDGAVLDGWRQVLHRHGGQRWSPQTGSELIAGAGAVPDLKPGDGADTHQAAFDPLGPGLCVDRAAKSDQGGGVDQPVGHSNASEAVPRAITEIHRAEPSARVLGLDQDLVSVTDIAQRIGVTRQAIGHEVAGTRGPGGFPRPDGVVGNGQRIWRWALVHEWLRQAEGIDVRFEDDAWPIPADEAVVLQADLQRRHLPAGA